ncbi:U-box domain-containing protein 40-like [Coffea arabica]|uniref:RING-type E3 ubiquitin transferase n=1 Tax=Coffea arabica TaxID=13443 RepID=A0ABM4V6X4_COFAR
MKTFSGSKQQRKREMGSGAKQKQLPKWKIHFEKSPKQKIQPPPEFVCPISGSLMVDPVIVSSGHSFERNCIDACKSLNFRPTLPDGSVPDFSTLIPNLALKSAILSWCHSTLFTLPPKPLDFCSAHNLVRTLLLASRSQQKPNHQLSVFSSQETEPTRTPSQVSTSSEESVTAAAVISGPTTPLPFTTRPSCCCSSSSSSDIESSNHPSSLEEDEFATKLRSSQVFEQEEALLSLRKLTRTQEESRVNLCTARLLSALRPLITSKYASVQVNSVAVVVNLSLENRNKVKIVRSGIVPPVIDVLRGGFPESQDHAAGALFSLALDDQNKTAIGVLGGLPPLLHALRSDSERTRHDSALALYHLSLVQSNRVKMVKMGSVQVLLGMARSGHMTGRILLVLGNLAASAEGRGAMLDGGAVGYFMEMLERENFDWDSTRESCVGALYGLSHGGLRFKGLAKEANAEEVLKKLEEMGSERSKEKVRRILEVLKQKDEEEEAVDWEELLKSDEEDASSGRGRASIR